MTSGPAAPAQRADRSVAGGLAHWSPPGREGGRRRARWGLTLVLMGAMGALGAQRAAWSLGAADLPQLIALDDRPVAALVAPELHWATHGASLTAAGRTADGEPVVFVAPVDGRPAVTIAGLVSSRIAISPDGSRVACWQRGPAGPGGAETARLAVFDSLAGTCVPIGGLAPFEATSPVVWLAEPERIVALRPRGDSTALAIFDPATGQPAPLMATVAGVGTVLRKGSTPGCVIVGTVGADGLTEYFLIDITTGIASNVPAQDQAALLAAGSGESDGISPGGDLVASCREDGLWIGTVEQPAQRLLLPRGTLGGHGFGAVSGPLWSPTAERLAYAVRLPDGPLSEVYVVTLGLEEIVCQIEYDTGARPPPVGAKVWVCMALQVDENGQPIEPEWKTLKAEMSVTSSPVPGVGGMHIRARNVGLQGGVLKRLTGLSEPPPDREDDSSLMIGPARGTPLTVVRSFTLPVRRGLIAWSDGSSTGKVVSVTVTRRALVLFGAPAP